MPLKGLLLCAAIFVVVAVLHAQSGCRSPATHNRTDEATSLGYTSSSGPFEVSTRLVTIIDRDRGRDVPCKAYSPRGAAAPLPFVVFSHGGGGTRHDGEFLCAHLAQHGYCVVAVEHEGSNLDALKQPRPGARGLRKRLDAMVQDPTNWSARPLDITLIIDAALAGDFGIEIDPERIGAFGHSFGAFAAMAVGGLLVDMPDDEDVSFRDRRVAAVVALSPQGAGRFGISDGAWDEIDVPLMMVTGTEDWGLRRGDPWTWRRQPFDELRARGPEAPTYLAVIEGAGHMAFADQTNPLLDAALGGRSPEFHAWTQQLTLAAFDAHLRGHRAARQWLVDGTIERATRGQVAFETIATSHR